jgi:2,3-diketo-5-methylthio-1-phosphopentane phosphatase
VEIRPIRAIRGPLPFLRYTVRMTAPGTFVCDFDGTLTRHDFYQLALARLLPPDTPDHWRAYRAGRLTHFEALAAYFAAIRAPEADVLAVVRAMGLDPELPTLLPRLRAAGWEVVVTSAGCRWYIDILLAEAGVSLEVHANPGRFVPGRGLLMHLPTDSPYVSPALGIDKAAVVRAAVTAGRRTAFAGDGYPDVDAARLAPPGWRFARAALAEALAAEGLPFRPFDRWADVARALLGG